MARLITMSSNSTTADGSWKAWRDNGGTYTDGEALYTRTALSQNLIWYRVVIKWTQSDVDPNIGIYVYNADGDLLDSETNNTNPNAWGTITGTTFYIGCYPWYAAETPAINIDGVKIWNAWKD